MKLKALVAALAIIGAGAANAVYDPFTPRSNPAATRGELFMSLLSSTGSAFFDLGITADKFSFANVGGVACSGACKVDKQITWNFQTGTVASTGAVDLSSVVSGVSGSWADAWNAYSPKLASSTFMVGAADRDGPALQLQKYLSTSASPQAKVATTISNDLTGFNQAANWHNRPQALDAGNHNAVANGANVVTDITSPLYAGYQDGIKTNWAGRARFDAAGNVGTGLDFYALDGVAGNSGLNKVVLTNYNGLFAIDAAAGTLTWTTLTAVPEPSSYAMLLAGLALMGVMARRRVK